MKLQTLERELSKILELMISNEDSIGTEIKQVHKDFKLSARNLYRYLILRNFDLRRFHDTLSDIGLSSMRTAEGYVMSNLLNVLKNVKRIQNEPFESMFAQEPKLIGYVRSKRLLKKHANLLFNATDREHFTEIMVTLPDEAAKDISIIRNMVTNGMEIARINLSHGDLEMWRKMVENVKKVEQSIEQKIKIYMDLSGPKIRTSTIAIYGKNGDIKNGIPIKAGDHIILTKRDTYGKESKFAETNEQLEKAEVSVQLIEIIDDAKVGDVVLFDDGMIRSEVIDKDENDLELKITATYKKKLSSHKGINLPNTKLNLPALTEKDIECLPFICQYADIVGYSFVRTGSDVEKLYAQLDKHNAADIGVVFKIENREAFENLPEILISGMRRNKIGVMIARGDLAVEVGFERISEVQNQILWLCAAAHVPVIWATQVLDNLAKTGIPTRAEISDAVLGAQAECVMLNKGPHINEAIRVLRDILVRMAGHSFKKKSELRPLNVSKKYLKNLTKRKPDNSKI
jgi:pyruvate kinase